MRIVMLSQAEWTNDSRIIREAESLVAVGHEVHVIARRPPNSKPAVEQRNGVVYHSIPHENNESATDVRALIMIDVRVRLAAARRMLGGPRRLAAARTAVQLSAVVLAAGVLVPGLIAAAKWPRLRARVDDDWRRSRFRERLLAIMQPLRYLNDFAYRAGWLIDELEPDVVHAHDLITLSAAVTIGRRRFAKVVYDAHELETQTNYHALSALTKKWIARYEATLVHDCHSVITVSDGIADWLAREYRIPRPTVVVNAPASRLRETDDPGLRETLGVWEPTPLVVYVGSVTVDRGLEATVEALAYLPGVHLATVGWRYGETERAMRKLAAAHMISDRVHFVDPVAAGDVIGFIRDASASVIPIQNVCLSYYYCFPNKLLESVFAGLPVAVANLAELSRFVTRYPVGVIMDERDPRAIAKAVQAVLERRAELRPTEETIAAIEREYGWQAQEVRLRRLYSSFARGGGGGASSKRTPPEAFVSAASPSD